MGKTERQVVQQYIQLSSTTLDRRKIECYTIVIFKPL